MRSVGTPLGTLSCIPGVNSPAVFAGGLMFKISSIFFTSVCLLGACFTINVIATSLGTLSSFFAMSRISLRFSDVFSSRVLVTRSISFIPPGLLNFLNIFVGDPSINLAGNSPFFNFTGTLITKLPSSLIFIIFLNSAISAVLTPKAQALDKSRERSSNFLIFDASLNFPAIAASSPILNAVVESSIRFDICFIIFISADVPIYSSMMVSCGICDTGVKASLYSNGLLLEL